MLGQAAQATISYLKLPQGNSCFPDGLHHDLNPLMNLACRCNADFYRLRGNVFPCTGLPLLVMYQHEHCSTLENIKYIYYHNWHNNEFSCI